MSVPRSRLPTTDELAEEMMSDLLKDRRFQKLWTDMVVELLSKESTPPMKHASRANRSPNNQGNNVVDYALCQLLETLQLCVDVFLRSSRLIAFDDASLPSDLNREFSTLYSIRVQLDRLCPSLEKFCNKVSDGLKKEAAVGLISRRFAHLLKAFAVRLSTPYAIKHHAFFAESLCEMLYRFEEYCCINEDSLQSAKLHSAIDNFHSTVVKGLSQVYHQEKPRVDNSCFERTQTNFSSSSLSKTTPSRSRSMVKLCSSGSFILSPEPASFVPASRKGYLLPANLEMARRRSSFHRNASRMTLSQPSLPRSGSAPGGRRSIRPSFGVSTKDRFLGLSTGINSEMEKMAMRQACEITKEIMEELAQRIDETGLS